MGAYSDLRDLYWQAMLDHEIPQVGKPSFGMTRRVNGRTRTQDNGIRS
jgi:hypothetical protein